MQLIATHRANSQNWTQSGQRADRSHAHFSNFRSPVRLIMSTVFFAGILLSLSGHGKGQWFVSLSIEPRPRASAKLAPALLAEGRISTQDDEFGATFTPDGQTCYFTKRTPATLSSSTVIICVSHWKGGHWSQPELASFSGHYKDFNPSLSPDGATLFFISNRPVEGKKRGDTDIWVVRKSSNGWTEPENIGSPVNTAGYELGCAVAANGTLYFCSTGRTGNLDLYCSRQLNGKYQQPESLGEAINTIYTETTPYIAPDESYILFASQGRTDALVGPGANVSYPRSDLYVSLRKDGKWTAAQNLGAEVNSDAEETNPWVSADGKTLYFTSERNFVSIPMKKKLTYPALLRHLHRTANGLGDIYQIPANKLLQNRP